MIGSEYGLLLSLKNIDSIKGMNLAIYVFPRGVMYDNNTVSPQRYDWLKNNALCLNLNFIHIILILKNPNMTLKYPIK